MKSLVNGTGREPLLHEELTGPIIGAFYDVYNELGMGFVESVYERAMEVALAATKLRFERQPRLSAYFRGSLVGEFRPDFVVEGRVVVELKAGRTLEPAHEAQLINYLRCGGIEVGLLFNFGQKPCFRRLLFTNRPTLSGDHAIPRLTSA